MAKRPSLPRPVPIQEIVKGLLGPGDRDVLAQRQVIRRVWEQVVPEELRQHAWLVDLRRRELWVEVSASPWGQELQFLRPRILEAMDQALGAGKIKDLRFRLAEKG